MENAVNLGKIFTTLAVSTEKFTLVKKKIISARIMNWRSLEAKPQKRELT